MKAIKKTQSNSYISGLCSHKARASFSGRGLSSCLRPISNTA